MDTAEAVKAWNCLW